MYRAIHNAAIWFDVMMLGNAVHYRIAMYAAGFFTAVDMTEVELVAFFSVK